MSSKELASKEEEEEQEEQEEQGLTLVPSRTVEKKAEQTAFLSALKYRSSKEGYHSFEETMWDAYDMIWQKLLTWGHRHETDPDVEDEICQDIMFWLSTMSGHGDEEGRAGRMNILLREIGIIMSGRGKLRVHKLLNLTGGAAFHHDIGFKQMREKTEFQMPEKQKVDIRLELKGKRREWEERRSHAKEVITQ